MVSGILQRRARAGGAGLAMLPMYVGFLGLVDDGHTYSVLLRPMSWPLPF